VNVAVANGAFDPAGGAVTVTAVTQGAHGTVVIETDGTVTYTPANGYEGSDSFTYTVTDSGSHPATGTIKLTVGLPAATDGDVITDDLSDIEEEIEDYPNTTAETIAANATTVAVAVTDYLGDISTYISATSIDPNAANKSANEFAMQEYTSYSTLAKKFVDLMNARHQYYTTAFALARSIESLALALNTAKTAPSPDSALINGLAQQIKTLIQVQVIVKSTYNKIDDMAIVAWMELRERLSALKDLAATAVSFPLKIEIMIIPEPTIGPPLNPFVLTPKLP